MADINPTSWATQLATAYTQGTQSLITQQTKTADATASALTKLRTALSNFNAALGSLSGKKSLLQNTATLSNTAVGTAKASASAQAGSYSFFVEQLASAHQVAFEDLPAVPVVSGGPLVVQQADGSSFTVDLVSADQDGNGTLSQAEIARAINLASGNGGKVTASIVTLNGQAQLMLTAGSTGAAGQISLDVSGLPDSDLKTALSTSRQMVAAQDAVIWLGEQGTGMRQQQASNTFTGIAGVELTFQQAMTAGQSPVTLTVASDSSGTADNVNNFVTAFNTLKSVLDDLTKTGESANQRGIFSTDAGVRSLKSRLNDILRQSFGGTSLMNLGVSADRQGKLSLDAGKLAQRLSANPDVLDQVFGSASITNSTGILGAMDRAVDTWLNSTNGQIQRRQDAVQTLQKTLAQRQTRLDDQFNAAYERYLAQFSRLQSLTSQMEETSGLFGQLSR